MQLTYNSHMHWEPLLLRATSVDFEDGSNTQVNAFAIGRYAVRVRDFDRFVQETGYRTTAERSGNPDTYIKSSVTDGLSDSELAEAPVTSVSFLDANAFCAWAGYRLPSEAEWLAAAVPDTTIYSREDYKNRRFPLENKILPDLGVEWTSTLDASGRAVLRRGPRWARTDQWRNETGRHRFVVPVESCDIMTTFRVVALATKEDDSDFQIP